MKFVPKAARVVPMLMERFKLLPTSTLPPIKRSSSKSKDERQNARNLSELVEVMVLVEVVALVVVEKVILAVKVGGEGGGDGAGGGGSAN